jgi:2-(3-amino-3-carboxypropyl)histidine synthase
LAYYWYGEKIDRINDFSLELSGYILDFKDSIKNINKNNFKKILIQLPEGLKSNFKKIIDYLEKKTNCDFLISADPCFGACDLVYYEIEILEIDLIIQIGHLPIPSIKDFKIPTIFVNAKSNIDILKTVKKAIPKLTGKKIGLISTAQHVHLLKNVRDLLEKNNYKYFIEKGDSRIYSKGQILGCNFSSATKIKDKVDCYLFIGSGNFHPLGLLLSTEKPVIVCDPFTNEIRKGELEELKDMILRQRYGAIARSKDSEIFGIIVGSKIGQKRIDLAYKLKEKIESKEKKAYIFNANQISPLNLESFRDIDCFVSTACPRIAIDDYIQYKIPILTPIELDILLGFGNWDEYRFDEILI